MHSNGNRTLYLWAIPSALENHIQHVGMIHESLKCCTLEYVGWWTPRPVAEHSTVWWWMGTMAVLSTELPWRESWRGEIPPMTKLEPPEEALLIGGPKRPLLSRLALSPSWFITVICGPKAALLLSLCESKLVCTSMECWWMAPPEVLELSRLRQGVEDTEDPDLC